MGCFLMEDSLDLSEPCGWVISVPTSRAAGHSECRADGCPGAPREVAASDIPCDTAQLIWRWCRESDLSPPGCIPSLPAPLTSHSSGPGVFLSIKMLKVAHLPSNLLSVTRVSQGIFWEALQEKVQLCQPGSLPPDLRSLSVRSRLVRPLLPLGYACPHPRGYPWILAFLGRRFLPLSLGL